jgi:hypothetical protein
VKFLGALKYGENFKRGRVTPDETMVFIAAHPFLQDSCKLVMHPIGIRPSLGAMIHYVGTRLLNDGRLPDDFVQVFNTGFCEYPSLAPAVRLREHCILMYNRGTPLTWSAQLRGAIHAYNLCVAKKKSKILIPNTPVEFERLDLDKI